MKRLIDASDLQAKLLIMADKFRALGGIEIEDRYRWAASVVEAAPTVDAVEVVRCRDCQWAENFITNGEFKLGCTKHNLLIKNNEFCSDGKRRKNND